LPRATRGAMFLLTEKDKEYKINFENA